MKKPEHPLPGYWGQVSERAEVRVGVPLPMGTYEKGAGVNFAFFSRHASRVWLQLFEHPAEGTPFRVIPLDPASNRTGDVSHVWVEGIRPGQLYAYGVDGPYQMPRVARLLPIPRRYDAKEVQRYGFHGLSYAYLMEELARLGDPAATNGRVIFAHLGNGASLAAARDGKSIDTSMGLTVTAGLPMSTRSGDLDPGLVSYLACTEQMTASQFQKMVNHESGMLGISEISSDMRDLLAQEARDVRAAEAVALFCYQSKKWIGSFAAALGGLDTLVFAGGIGESAPLIRERICQGLGFLGIELNNARNADAAGLISADAGRVTVRVIPTDEELMISRSVLRSCTAIFARLNETPIK